MAKIKGDSGKKLEFLIKTIPGNEVPCTWERQFPLMGTLVSLRGNDRSRAQKQNRPVVRQMRENGILSDGGRNKFTWSSVVG
ncbi:hypothetical protein [Bacteroides sp.]|jgi:hypothetical protein|uniref:hypothetical protein n=1 Tax=Bacteroides sp. TaxID=29523 RepID=UPI0025C0A9F2|nr:hypothetical protein [Bacteroides sp.]